MAKEQPTLELDTPGGVMCCCVMILTTVPPQVDAKLAEEQLKMELDTLGGDVSRRFAGVEAEAERTRKRLAKERKDLEALEGLVQVGGCGLIHMHGGGVWGASGWPRSARTWRRWRGWCRWV